MLTDKENEESLARVEDVCVGIRAYGQMMATAYHMAGQNPMVPLIGADWMAMLLFKLQEWGVLTHTQYEQVMMRMREEVAERRAVKGEEDGGQEGDRFKDLLSELGI